ncbi:unnamed protein product, partial [Ectocarpus fasciculatus]
MADFRRRLAIAALSRTDGQPLPVLSVEHLCIGSVGCAVSAAVLRAAGITHTLCVGEGVLPPPQEIVAELGLTHCHFGVKDTPESDICSIFEPCFAFIEECKRLHGRVLVYCFQGKSRSVTVAAAYLMKYYGLSFVSALETIRQTRPIASPNLGFTVVLRRYERELVSSTEEGKPE